MSDTVELAFMLPEVDTVVFVDGRVRFQASQVPFTAGIHPASIAQARGDPRCGGRQGLGTSQR